MYGIAINYHKDNYIELVLRIIEICSNANDLYWLVENIHTNIPLLEVLSGISNLEDKRKNNYIFTFDEIKKLGTHGILEECKFSGFANHKNLEEYLSTKNNHCKDISISCADYFFWIICMKDKSSLDMLKSHFSNTDYLGKEWFAKYFD
jgi:hypothetical protein